MSDEEVTTSLCDELDNMDADMSNTTLEKRTGAEIEILYKCQKCEKEGTIKRPGLESYTRVEFGDKLTLSISFTPMLILDSTEEDIEKLLLRELKASFKTAIKFSERFKNKKGSGYDKEHE